jgi:eukaryotic-like serine/threonine-protein kinase
MVKRLEPGTRIIDRFEILGLIGHGGMSLVYRALDRATGKSVALKFFASADLEALERFALEAKLLASLTHPGIVEHVASGVFHDQRYLAMEWLDGVDLSQKLAEGPLTPEATTDLAMGVSAALAAAHEVGVVHRDIKPANIFLVGGLPTRPKLLDFGIARNATAPRLTKVGEALGTPAYMAPEQARGATVDASADVFSLGCVLYECLAGKPPFWAEHPLATMAKILLEEAPPLSASGFGVPQALSALVQEMLAKEPSQRPADGRALLARLHAARAAMGVADADVEAERPRSITTLERKLLSVIFVGNVPETDGVQSPTTEVTQVSPSTGQQADLFFSDIMRHGGWAERLIDGTVVVTLPGAGPLAEQAARAARCALSVRQTLPESPVVLVTGRADVAGGFPVGEVIERGVALLDQAYRDLADEAAAADAPAPIRGVSADEVTAGLLDRRFELEARASGFQLLAEIERRIVPPTLLGKAQSFVGREMDIARVVALFRETVAGLRSHHVRLLGRAGFGKSRFLQELGTVLVSLPDAPTVAWARAHQSDAQVPLRLAARLLSSFIGLVDHESQSAMRHRVRARLGRNLDSRDSARVAAFLGELVGVRFEDDQTPLLSVVRADPVRLGDQIRAALVDFLDAELRASPVALLIDDIHWADPASVALLEQLQGRFERAPLFLLSAADEASSASSGDSRSVTRLVLEPLRPEAARSLALDALGPLSRGEDLERLVEAANGNVLHLEELIRAFHEGRGVGLPATVAGIVQTRLEALAPNLRRVLRACAVLGDSFTDDAVGVLLGESAGDVKTELAKLARAELLVGGSSITGNGRPIFTFRSATIRDAAYESLIDEDRIVGHGLAADWIESHGSHRDAILVAQHREKSGQPEKAVGWYVRAAIVALEGNDYQAVIERAERGLSLGAEGAVRGRLAVLLSESYRHLGRNSELLSSSIDGLRVLPRGTPVWWTAYANAVLASIRLGRTEVTSELCAMVAPDLLVDLPADAARASHYLLFGGRDQPADDILLHAMQHIGPFAEDPAKWAWAYRAHATRAILLGDIGSYGEQLDLAVRAFELAGDVRNTASERVNLGFAHAELGLYEVAQSMLEQAKAGAAGLGLKHVVGAAESNLGLVLFRLGALPEAEEVLRRVVAAFAAQSNRRMEGNSRNYLARLLLRRGRLDEAKAEIEQAESLLEAIPTLVPSAMATRGRVLLARGSVEEARVVALEAMARFEATGRLDEGEALVRLVLAEVAYASGDKLEAAAAITSARARLLTRAQAIHDAAWRKSFLENVEENRRTLQLAEVLTG